MSNIDKRAELRKELSNPANGSNSHLRKLALALLDELEAEGRQNGYLREQRDKWERKAISNFEECSEMAQCIEVLESHRQMAFMASNRWSDKFREADKRIVEQVEIIAKQEKWIKDVEVTMIAATDRAEAAEKRIAELEASHSNLRKAMAGIHNTITGGGTYTPLAAILTASKRAYEESAAAAGKGE